ncbi:hypothetical protein F5883DRAFT_558306 [Diaporthe sp. PMI_573]|nr:hypothetical protein F5883DRAFT_558306 [Diaporthaceae sp. PMI_573]
MQLEAPMRRRLSLRSSGSSALFLALIYRCWTISIEVSHSALHSPRTCLPALHRAVQVITLEVPCPVRTLDENGLNLAFASNFPKGTLSQRSNHPRPPPWTLAHLGTWLSGADPHQIAITRLLACIVTLTNVLVLPRYVRRQNASPIAYPIPGNLIRHSG